VRSAMLKRHSLTTSTVFTKRVTRKKGARTWCEASHFAPRTAFSRINEFLRQNLSRIPPLVVSFWR